MKVYTYAFILMLKIAVDHKLCSLIFCSFLRIEIENRNFRYASKADTTSVMINLPSVIAIIAIYSC